MMNILLAVCFLFFCAPKQHQHRVHSNAPVMLCDDVNNSFAASHKSRDDFVRAYPTQKQRSVLTCLGDD